MILLFAHAALAAGVADCQETFTTPDLLAAADAADAQFVSLDAAGFNAARSTLELRLTCTTDTLDGSTMGRVHRVEALGAFIDGASARVPQALAGLIAADPGHQLPTELVPVGHPVRAALAPAGALLRDDRGVPMPKLASGWIEVDTTARTEAPGTRAAVLQQIDGQGNVLATHYRWPDEPGFDWVVIPAATASRADIKPAAASPNVRSAATGAPSPWVHRAPLLGLAVASLGTSAALLAMASAEHGEFTRSEIMPADASDAEKADYRTELEGMQAHANALSVGWITAGSAGLALGAFAVVTW